MLFVDFIFNSLQEHRNQQSNERQKLYKHRKKCYDAPHKYMGLIIDGMDQKKTLLPHFVRVPKNLKEEILFSFTWLGVLFLMVKCFQGFTLQLHMFTMMQI